MSYFFASYQIADLAIQIEEAGSGFYRALAEQTQNPEVKNTFLELMKQEIGHEKDFAGIRDEEKNDSNPEEYSVDLFSLMKTAIDDLKKGAFNLDNLRGADFDLSESMDLAINAEIQSIAVYSEMQAGFISRFENILGRIIDQEKTHLVILRQMKNRLFNKPVPI